MIKQPDITLQRVYERLRKLEAEAQQLQGVLEALTIDASQVVSGTLDRARQDPQTAYKDEVARWKTGTGQGDVTLGNATTDGGFLQITGSSPILDIFENDAGVNAKRWRWNVQSEILKLISAQDTGVNIQELLTIDRNGNVVLAGNISVPSSQTAFTASSGSGINRARFGQFSDNFADMSHNLRWTGDWTRDDTNLTAALFRLNPSFGLEFFTAPSGANPATLTRQFRVGRSGEVYERARAAAMGDWVPYTPTWGGGLSPGNGTSSGRHTKIGGTVFFFAQFTFGSTSAINGTSAISASLPSPALQLTPAGIAILGAHTGQAFQMLMLGSTNAALIYNPNPNSVATGIQYAFPTASTPYTWGAGANIRVWGFYEE